MTDDFPRNRMTAAFERRVARVLDVALPAGAPIVVACSGGPDSSAALVATVRARGHDVVAAHFDHGMRPRTDVEADRAAVETLAERLDAGFACGAGSHPHPTSEASAREARYTWLAKVCADAGIRYCATGHTLDDQAETVLLRITRGAGLGGVASMAAEAAWPVAGAPSDLRLVRPLLGVRRLEVLSYLEALGIDARSDATNELVTFHRNRLRHRVLPELRAVNPRVDEALARFAALARRDDDALDAWSQREFAAIASVRQGRAALDRGALRALPPAVASRVLRLAAAVPGVHPDGQQVETMLRLVGRRGARLSLTGGEFVVEADEVVLQAIEGPRGSV